MENIIYKYLTNSISKEELAKLKVWLTNPENKVTFKRILKENHQLSHILTDNIDVETSYNKIEDHIQNSKKPAHKIFRTNFYKYAAAILLLFSTYLFYHYSKESHDNLTQNEIKNSVVLKLNDGNIKYLQKGKTQKITNKSGEVIAAFKNDVLTYSKNNSTPSLDEIYVPNGKIFSLVLADNSKITINSGSTLQFPNSFIDKKNRTVLLKGEAYFNVAKNKLKPFIVRTKDMNVKVLGTKFNVNSYSDNIKTSVVLEEGSIIVNKSSEGLNFKNSKILKPKEKIIAIRDSLLITEVSMNKYIAWKKRQLFFKNDRFEDILKKLERYYDVSIKIESSKLNDTRFTGTFTTETINEVFDVFKELSDFNYIKKGKSIIITN